jgi:uncharacterized phage-like protein YoqJ
MQLDIETTACFTGHRPPKTGGYDNDNPIMRNIRDWLRVRVGMAYEAGIRTFISGMALGVDQVAAEVVLEYKSAGCDDIKLVAAVPFDGQECRWPVASQRYYTRLIQLADECVVVCAGGYAAWKMQVRNKWMVDRSRLVLAVWDGSLGGTANAVHYAYTREPRKPVVWRFNPRPQ